MVRIDCISLSIPDPSFLDWWQRIEDLTLGMVRKWLNSLIVLGAWTI
jgi:hypothetical protein